MAMPAHSKQPDKVHGRQAPLRTAESVIAGKIRSRIANLTSDEQKAVLAIAKMPSPVVSQDANFVTGKFQINDTDKGKSAIAKEVDQSTSTVTTKKAERIKAPAEERKAKAKKQQQAQVKPSEPVQKPIAAGKKGLELDHDVILKKFTGFLEQGDPTEARVYLRKSFGVVDGNCHKDGSGFDRMHRFLDAHCHAIMGTSLLIEKTPYGTVEPAFKVDGERSDWDRSDWAKHDGKFMPSPTSWRYKHWEQRDGKSHYVGKRKIKFNKLQAENYIAWLEYNTSISHLYCDLLDHEDEKVQIVDMTVCEPHPVLVGGIQVGTQMRTSTVKVPTSVSKEVINHSKTLQLNSAMSRHGDDVVEQFCNPPTPSNRVAAEDLQTLDDPLFMPDTAVDTARKVLKQRAVKRAQLFKRKAQSKHVNRNDEALMFSYGERRLYRTQLHRWWTEKRSQEGVITSPQEQAAMGTEDNTNPAVAENIADIPSVSALREFYQAHKFRPKTTARRWAELEEKDRKDQRSALEKWYVEHPAVQDEWERSKFLLSETNRLHDWFVRADYDRQAKFDRVFKVFPLEDRYAERCRLMQQLENTATSLLPEDARLSLWYMEAAKPSCPVEYNGNVLRYAPACHAKFDTKMQASTLAAESAVSLRAKRTGIEPLPIKGKASEIGVPDISLVADNQSGLSVAKESSIVSQIMSSPEEGKKYGKKLTTMLREKVVSITAVQELSQSFTKTASGILVPPGVVD